MTRRLAHEIKNRLSSMGFNRNLWRCKFMFKVDGIYYFKVVYDGNTAHGEYLIWECYFSGDNFVGKGKISQEVN